MTEVTNYTVIIKKIPSDEYRALVRAAEAAKKQAELLGLPYVTKNSELNKTSV